MDHYSIIEPPSPDKDRGVAPEEPAMQPGEPAGQLPADPTATVTGPSETEAVSATVQESSFLPPSSQPQPLAPRPEESATDLDAALQALAQKAQYVSNATGAAIALRQGAEVVCRAASGNSAPDRGARLQIKTGLTAECLRKGELMRCDNAMTDSRVDLESCRRLGIDSIIIAPIRCRQSVAGVLEIFSAHAYSFQERDVETVKALAEEIGNLLQQGQMEEPVVVTEAPALDLAAPGQIACQNCGTRIDHDAVFCAACGSFQESAPAHDDAGTEATDWKARLSSRRLVVPAIFVAMALAVAVAPISRKPANAAPAATPALQASAAPPAAKPAAPVHSRAGNGPSVETRVETRTADSSPTPATNNPTIANSVKQLLGGVSSDFSKLLPVNEKAEPSSNGDPNLRVWVDTRKGYYYCPGEDQYGHTQRGSFMTQKEAEASYYIPALIKPCM